MAEILVNAPFQFTYWINHEDNGFSETWWLLDLDRTSALATAARLLEARRYILARDCVIEWAEIRELVTPHNVQAAIGDPLLWIDRWTWPGADAVSLLFRFETATGKFVNHHIRAIADDEIHNNRWVRDPAEIVLGPYALPIDPVTSSKDDLFKHFIKMFRTLTCHCKYQGIGVDLLPWWKLTEWDSVQLRHVSSSDPGSAVRRLSWEPGEFDDAPDFSPCGVVMTVGRTCRQVDCRFYVNGPVQQIRFYFAGPHAEVYTEPHIFYGLYRDKDYRSDPTVGERKGAQRTVFHPSGTWEYQLGYSAGLAPGIVASGTPTQFLGQGVKPWPDSEDGLPHYGRICDMPLAPPITIDNDDLSVVDPHAFRLTIGVGLKLTHIAPHHDHIEATGAAPSFPFAQVLLADKWTNDLAISYTRTGDTIQATTPAQQFIADGQPLLLGDILLYNPFWGGPKGTDGGLWRCTDSGIDPPVGPHIATLVRVPEFTFELGSLVHVRSGPGLGGTTWSLYNVTEIAGEHYCIFASPEICLDRNLFAQSLSNPTVDLHAYLPMFAGDSGQAAPGFNRLDKAPITYRGYTLNLEQTVHAEQGVWLRGHVTGALGTDVHALPWWAPTGALKIGPVKGNDSPFTLPSSACFDLSSRSLEPTADLFIKVTNGQFDTTPPPHSTWPSTGDSYTSEANFAFGTGTNIIGNTYVGYGPGMNRPAQASFSGAGMDLVLSSTVAEWSLGPNFGGGARVVIETPDPVTGLPVRHRGLSGRAGFDAVINGGIVTDLGGPVLNLGVWP